MTEAAYHAALLELQHAIQPPVPEWFDPELGVHYVPADKASAGGDIYDWQLLDDGLLHLAVVDVAGKGLSAVRDALTVVHALRLLSVSGAAVSDLIGSADRLLAGTYPDLVATAVVARYEPGTGALRIASGGHPPPLLVEPDGRTTFLSGTGGPIGFPKAGSEDEVAVGLAPGSVVVFYTDGLVEAHRDIGVGMAELRSLARRVAGGRAADVAQTLVQDTLAGADRHDDTLAVTLRRPPTPE